MRAPAVLLILAGFTLSAYAAKRVTVADLEQTLAATRQLSDGELAKQLMDLELTERLNTESFDRMDSALPGKQSRQALMILADESVFLNPPPAELPAQPAPDIAGQRRILALTVNYVTQTLHRLPNFFGTRVTTSFEDSPAVTTPGRTTTAYQPIHLIGKSKVTVTFRQGREVVETSSVGPQTRTLTTSGVFGPILGTVLLDAARSKLVWSHWEQGASRLQAVFSYEVPKDNSHYTITYDSVPTNRGGKIPCVTIPQATNEVVAYHGEMTIDPATGTILRLVLLADTKPDEMVVQSGIEVEYGQVRIGGKDYFLPTRSVTTSLAHSLIAGGGWGHGQGCPTLTVKRELQKSLNDVAFLNYHVFRAGATVLTSAEAASLERQTSPDSKGSNQTGEASTPPLATASSATPLPPSGPEVTQFSGTAAHSANPSERQSQPHAQPSQSDTATAAAITPPSSPPPQPAAASAADISSPAAYETSTSSGVPVLRTTARQVLVDIVVDQKNGDPVAGLPKADFFVSENGKKQAIDFFEEHSAAASAPVAQPAMPPLPPGASTNVPTAPPSSALYVFLLDSLNSEPQDQVYVRQQVLAFLQKLEPGTEIAVFSLDSGLRLIQGFTSNPHRLLAALSRTHAERAPMAQTRSDNAEDAQHMANLAAMRSAVPQLEQYSHAETAQTYSFGARASMTFEALNALARYLEGIPGRKNLVWFSSSFPVVFFPTASEMEHFENNVAIRGYLDHAQQTADLFTLSKIAVYPVSGTGVMNSNVGLADSPGAGSAGGTSHFGTASAPTASLTGEAMNSASAFATMEELAGPTGGRAFATNDIDSALRKIVHDSEDYYTIGYAPMDSASDGSFRRIDVKVAGGKYKLAYRHGYNVSEPGAAPFENPITPLLQLGLPSATGILYGGKVERSAATESTASDAAIAGQNTQLKGAHTRFTVSLTLRAQDISFGQAANGDRIAKLLIGVKAYGKDGVALNWQSSREVATLTPAQYASFAKTGLPVSIDLDLPPNTSAQFVTAVYDWNSARSGTLEIDPHP